MKGAAALQNVLSEDAAHCVTAYLVRKNQQVRNKHCKHCRTGPWYSFEEQSGKYKGHKIVYHACSCKGKQGVYAFVSRSGIITRFV